MNTLSDRHRAMLDEMGIRTFQPPRCKAAPKADPKADPKTAPARPAAAQTALQAAPQTAPKAAPAAPPVAAPAAAAVAQMDWPALQAAVASCTACPLAAGCRQSVFGAGHPQARWMIVGEAPGEQEDRQGQPFVGPAGQLLDAMLEAIGLSRQGEPGAAPLPATPHAAKTAAPQGVFIANVLKCRPPGNRAPQPAEIAQCAPFLRRQLELVQPAIILALGRFAVQSLLGSDEPIGRLRGRVHRYQGIPVIVTYHPAYLLRNPLDKHRAWQDLCLALQVSRQGGEPAA